MSKPPRMNDTRPNLLPIGKRDASGIVAIPITHRLLEGRHLGPGLFETEVKLSSLKKCTLIYEIIYKTCRENKC